MGEKLGERKWLTATVSSGIEELVEAHDRYKEACKLYREASIQSHNGHWDGTMRGGLGCPECLRAKELRQRADKLLEAGYECSK